VALPLSIILEHLGKKLDLLQAAVRFGKTLQSLKVISMTEKLKENKTYQLEQTRILNKKKRFH
jgi:hypothetical protein